MLRRREYGGGGGRRSVKSLLVNLYFKITPAVHNYSLYSISFNIRTVTAVPVILGQ